MSSSRTVSTTRSPQNGGRGASTSSISYFFAPPPPSHRPPPHPPPPPRGPRRVLPLFAFSTSSPPPARFVTRSSIPAFNPSSLPPTIASISRNPSKASRP